MDELVNDEVRFRLNLRDYQEEAARAVLGASGDRKTVKVVSLPTGSGKTVVGVAVAVYLVRMGYTVLWTCKCWRLLRAAVQEFEERFPEVRHLLRRIGGASKRFELGRLPEGEGGQIYFATIQSWHRRRGTRAVGHLGRTRLAVVWDEVHWGFGTTYGRAIRSEYLHRAAVAGLTATPPLDGCAEVVFEKTFAELVGTVLATPVVESAPTGVRWTPAIRHADYTPASLDGLARTEARNAQIADVVVRLRAEGRARYILVFAISITHAEELTQRLAERGVPARVVHCNQSQADQEGALAAFREHRVDVLVNVAMLAEGFDFPPTDAVVLARPCRSRALLTQMIGRGARLAPGKDTFIVVDVQDDPTRYADLLVRAADVVPAARRPVLGPRAYRPPVRHAEPVDRPRFENYAVAGYGTLPIALGHTFGVEIEFTPKAGVPLCSSDEWEDTARKAIAKLNEHVTAPVHPHPLEGKDGPLTHWRVVYDASTEWEVVSPILVDAAGFDELRRACEAISELVEGSRGALCVNHRAGLHLTLAKRWKSDNQLKGFVKLVQRLEPGLFTLVAPSRLYPFSTEERSYSRRAGNRYCRPLRELREPDRLDLDEFVGDNRNRYHTVNLTKSEDDIPVIEVRMHHGTHDFRKVALWTSLWMQIFNAARYRWEGPARPGLVLPSRNSKISLAQADREDIVALLKEEEIELTPEFITLLRQRRAELRPSWAKVLPNRVSRWEAVGWYAAASPDAARAIGNSLASWSPDR